MPPTMPSLLYAVLLVVVLGSEYTTALTGTRPPWLRIIQINDVYKLQWFPHLKTLVDTYAANGPDVCQVVCAGDFLAPSILSSLDDGYAMVDCLNAVGVTHVCLGNHEADVPTDALRQRIRQANFVWVNSNMPDLVSCLGLDKEDDKTRVVTHSMVDVCDKRVAFLGLLTNDPSLYRPDAFGGAHIESVPSSASAYMKQLTEKEVDLVIPLTHQDVADDRALSAQFNFPIIIGGHDHEPFLEQGLVKTGMDAENAAIIDIQWPVDGGKPNISVTLHKTADFAPDPLTVQRVQAHETILCELERSTLFNVTDWTQPDQVFSTRDNRLGRSTGTTALASLLRMGMRCDCALINAGAVRGNRDYLDAFTWADLQAELPFDLPIIVCPIPGHVLQKAIAYSRQWAAQGIAKGGFLHTSRSIQYDETTQKIRSIGGLAVDLQRHYLTALPVDILRGMDDQMPLLEWAASDESGPWSDEAAIPAKIVLVRVFSALLWLHLGNFQQLSRGDGKITRENIHERLVELLAGDPVENLVVKSVYDMADLDKSGSISALEQMVMHFMALDMLDHVVTEKEVEVMNEVVQHVLGKSCTGQELRQMAERLHRTLDLRGTGSIQRVEILDILNGIHSNGASSSNRNKSIQ